MASSHLIEYSKSSRAQCHGSPPCKGTLIDLGRLRYGKTIKTEYGENVEWRHWGCVDAAILGALARVPPESIPGFSTLRAPDQQKIRRAIQLRRVDPSDIPSSAKVAAVDLTQRKRKADEDIPGSSQQASQASSSTLVGTQASSQRVANGSDETEENLDNEALDDESRDELYCSLKTSVVGIQYYKGLVGAGEEVLLVREPHNRYDSNAIQVKNIGRAQVGHLPRNVAAKLAPLMDRRSITVEGVIHEGNLSGRSYSLSMSLKIYGPSDRRDVLEPQLIWATPHQRGFPPRNTTTSGAQAYSTGSSSYASVAASQPGGSSRASQPAVRQSAAQIEAQRKQQEALIKAQELKQMIHGLEKVDDEGRRSSLLDNLCSVEDILNLPLHPNPPSIKSGDLKVDLLKHQSQALEWCVRHEYPVLPTKETDKPVQFWQLRKTGNKSYYFNVATKTPQDLSSPPVLGRGALCADSMGLGKTLTMLALVLATKTDVPLDHSRSTLIVVPLSVMSNWEKQIQDHCVPDALTYCVYYGNNRSLSAKELGKYDVVITTYQTVTAEHADPSAKEAPSKKKQKTEKSLFGVRWKRIILDEGHNIRNPKTKMAKAVCALTAQRRWVLTGTPIINSPRDLGSALTFLQICQPLDNEDFFKRMLLRPLKEGNPAGAELLRALMGQICIRRTKEMQDSAGNYLVPLPPVEMIVVPVTLSTEARDLYDEAEQLSKQHFENYMNSSTNSFAQSNVLGMLTRLRQLALHPGLVPANYIEDLKNRQDSADAPTITITPEVKARLQAMLAQAIEDSEECPICFSILDDARITPCTHHFCTPCITEVISRDPKCPMDRRAISMADLIKPPPPTELTQAPVRLPDEDTIRVGSSAKIDQLINLLQLTPAGEKSLVFSQFTSFLDKIAEAFEEQGISYVRFDGQMSAKRRQEAIAQFSVPLADDAAVLDCPASATQQAGSQSRSRKRSSRVILDDDDVAVNDQQDDDAEFVVQDEDDDDDFIDDDDDDSAFAKKGKGKGKGKGKQKATSKVKRASLGSGNPKVMLISLKAGALGLNLTVANNVYLMDPYVEYSSSVPFSLFSLLRMFLV
ncbi:hypothetical protein HGRIS_002620 [Hohenbuehelia grisea]|uniref:Uncharacterized protein n=1 Tax=Hohenbuehelia grisea TaxID=104357 RepID=A0ABR3JL26_9AGAR